MRSAVDCPILITETAPSKDYGFQKVVIRNDARRAISAINLRVVLINGSGDEDMLDAAAMAVQIEPGERKTMDLGLARIEQLKEIAAKAGLTWIRAVLYAERVYFADGSHWDEHASHDPQ